MASVFQNRPLIVSFYLGFLLLPFLYLINSFSPPPEKAPEGYNSTIIAFEMVSNESELKEVLEPLTPAETKGLDMLNYIDFGFMLTYGLFLFLFISKFSEVTRSAMLAKAKWIAPVIVICDMLENIQLLTLSKFTSDSTSNTETAITLLATFTWAKWLLLGLAFAIIGRSLLKMKMTSRVLGFVLLIPLILGLLAFTNGKPSSEDLFATSTFVAFFLIFIYSFSYKDPT